MALPDLYYKSLLSHEYIDFGLLSKNSNLSWNIIKHKPDADWSWYNLTRVRDLPLDFIEKNINKPDFNWYDLSNNINITEEFVLKHIDCDWNWFSLCESTSFSISFYKICLTKTNSLYLSLIILLKNPNISIEKFIEIYKLDYNYLSCSVNLSIDYVSANLNEKWSWPAVTRNKNITCEDILNNLHMPWDFTSILYNPNITWDLIQKISNKFTKKNWSILSEHKVITWDIIITNQTIPWDWSNIIINPNITSDIILKNIDYPWRFETLSFSDKITYEIIMKTIDKPWRWNILSANPLIDINILKQTIDKKWDWKLLSKNRNLTPEFIKEYIHMPWDYNTLSKIGKISHELILSTKHLIPWKLRYICGNLNIPIETILKYYKDKDVLNKPEFLNRTDLTTDLINTLCIDNKYKYLYLYSNNPNILEIPNSIIQKYFAIKKIWRYWFQAITNPAYMLCKKRLLNELNNL